MPRPVAVFFGIMLAALSIGFNIMRYPVVWDMVAPARAAKPAQSETVPQPQKSENPQPLSQESRPIEVKALPEVGRQAALSTPPATTGRENTPRSLVPIIAVSLSNNDGGRPVGNAGIHRLPSVTVGPRNPLEMPIPDGRIPIYPTTGIE